MSVSYRVVIRGVRKGIAIEQAVAAAAPLFRMTEAALRPHLEAAEFVVKKGIDLQTAAKYQIALEERGLACVVEPESSTPAPEPLEQPTESHTPLTKNSKAAPSPTRSSGMSSRAKVVLLFAGFLIVGSVAKGWRANSDQEKGNRKSEISTAAVLDQTNANKVAPTATPAPSPAATKSQWTYDFFVDRLTGQKQERYAELEANNVLNLKFPYSNGGTKVWLLVYADKEEMHVKISLSQGQFGNRFTRIRFDDGEPIDNMNLTINGGGRTSEDNRRRTFTTDMSSRPKQDFFAMLKASKRLRMELPIFDNDYQVVEFSTAELDPTILPDAATRSKKGK